ncbi:MAG: aminotransferase class III-fold pyridoxal phosphate-dependent enzyme, partial [Desulfofustis sp.]|nr:aminotransferase class III-fold pyridoxal phosphate-dependent enzyme [Desulfofustis sp.]
DIVALSKGMASGYFPLGAVMCRGDIVDDVLAAGGFPHGHTYAGNPMACAVGRAVLKRIVDDGLADRAAAMGERLLQGLRRLAVKYPIIGEVRGKGLLTALEFVSDRGARTPFANHLQVGNLVTARAFDNGLIVYPRRSINGLSGDHILVAPPLIIKETEVDELLDRLDRSLDEASTRLAGA